MLSCSVKDLHSFLFLKNCFPVLKLSRIICNFFFKNHFEKRKSWISKVQSFIKKSGPVFLEIHKSNRMSLLMCVIPMTVLFEETLHQPLDLKVSTQKKIFYLFFVVEEGSQPPSTLKENMFYLCPFFKCEFFFLIKRRRRKVLIFQWKFLISMD